MRARAQDRQRRSELKKPRASGFFSTGDQIRERTSSRVQDERNSLMLIARNVRADAR